MCPKCGTIDKSGKASCCGLGGSWFRNCGGVGNRKLRHTWHEGIVVCKTRAQLKPIRPRQPKGVQRLNSFYGIDMGNSKAVIRAAATFPLTRGNTSISMATVNIATTTSDSTSTKYHSVTAKVVLMVVVLVRMSRVF